MTLVDPCKASTPPQAVGILGGMGPTAGAEFARLFVQACAQHLQHQGRPVTDQAFPEHWLVQVPVPDRTQALFSPAHDAQQPLEPMAQALGRLAALGVKAVAIACNTAHAWHASLQARFPHIDVLHVAQEVALALQAQGVRDVALLATEGSYRVGVYEQALAAAGLRCHLPQEAEKHALMEGIYQGVKANNLALAQARFGDVAQALAQRHPGCTLVMGCTEIPLALPQAPQARGLALLDPADVLARALVRRAYEGPSRHWH